MNARQLEHLSSSLNKTQQIRQSSKAASSGRRVAKYNLNRASLGGIIGQQKQNQAHRTKHQLNLNAKPNLMPNIHDHAENVHSLA